MRQGSEEVREGDETKYEMGKEGRKEEWRRRAGVLIYTINTILYLLYNLNNILLLFHILIIKYINYIIILYLL